MKRFREESYKKLINDVNEFKNLFEIEDDNTALLLMVLDELRNK